MCRNVIHSYIFHSSIYSNTESIYSRCRIVDDADLKLRDSADEDLPARNVMNHWTIKALQALSLKQIYIT